MGVGVGVMEDNEERNDEEEKVVERSSCWRQKTHSVQSVVLCCYLSILFLIDDEKMTIEHR